MRSFSLLLALVGILGVTGCAGGAVESGAGTAATAGPPLPYATLGELSADIAAAQLSTVLEDRRDTDGDGLPDIVEERLGTDPRRADTDGDGLVDAFETFGDTHDPDAPLPDHDRDGLTAAVDADDDGDFSNDGLEVDTDGDGVANYLEFYGYTFDVLTGKFRPWNGDESVPHFFTDPLQPSTDQDAYPDGMEASGALLDPTVLSPGDDPLVPAVPNVVFELRGYRVTLNETIEVTDTTSLAKGQEWSRETEVTHEYTNESTWEIGGEAGYDDGVVAKVSGKVGGMTGSTHSTATTVAAGASILSETGWSRARSVNPTDAARLKLFVKVENRGTAPISDLVPTLTLRIGGLDVLTFEPRGASIAMLVPGEQYPDLASSTWVIDAAANGSPLSLTMWELRALEEGAPVSLVLAQTRGRVMRLATGGVWEDVGDISQHSGRCDAVCASVRIELADGTSLRQMVYADDEPSSPPMTLGRALAHLGVDAGMTLHWVDADGTPHERSLADCTFAIDPRTLRANGWVLRLDGAPVTVAPSDLRLKDHRLFPWTEVLVRAPRDPNAPQGPEVHFACFDGRSGEVRASAADYRGVASARVLDEDDHVVLDLLEEPAGSGFYVGYVRAGDTFDSKSFLSLVVTNLDGLETSRDLGRLFEPRAPVAPRITSVSFDKTQVPNRLYANVENGSPDGLANSEVLWVRAFHKKFTGGDADLDHVVNFYEEPDLYDVEVPFTHLATDDPIVVVAYVAPGIYTEHEVTAEETVENQVFATASPELYAYTQRNPWLVNLRWVTRQVDFDKAPAKVSSTTVYQNPTPPAPNNPVDLWVRVDAATPSATARVGFNMNWVRMSSYSAISKTDVITANPSDNSPLLIGKPGGLNVNDVFGFRTASGRIGKFRVLSIDLGYSVIDAYRDVTLKLQYTTWK